MRPRWLCLTLTLTLLGGCGYHLARTRDLAPVMRRTRIVAPQPYGDLARGLARGLGTTNVEVAQSAEEATATLKILRDSASRRVVSVNRQDRPQAYELHYAIEFTVLHDGKTLLEPKTIALNRTFAFGPDNVLSANQEARQLIGAMRADLIQVLLRQLVAIRPAQSATDDSTPSPRPGSTHD